MAGLDARRGEAVVVLALAIIACCTNDAFGRLIARQAPWPGMPGEIRTERYLHDGVRRIQEIWREPAQGNGAEGGQNQNNGPPVYTEYTAREYVHSPGYVDEFVAEIDTSGTVDTFWWVLQDPNYNVVALVSDGDGSGGPGSGGTYRGEVARQYSWSPYGELLRADIYDTSAPMSRLGHQGLFHDRLDADILSEPMVAFARQAVQNRNRTLLTWLGRFAQQDPNASGLSVLTHLAQQGDPMGAGVGLAKADVMFSDGMNLHGYVRQQPLGRQDPLGLASAIEVGGVGAIQGFLNTLIAGGASVGASISGLATNAGMSAGAWAVSVTGSGALVVGSNYHTVMMYGNVVDSNFNNWINGGGNSASGGGQPPRWRAESKLRGSRKHGINWTEGPQRAKITGNPQGQFRSEADVQLLERMASQFEKGYVTPGQGLPLPPGHTMVLHMPNGTMVQATHVFFKIRMNGIIHGFPTP